MRLLIGKQIKDDNSQWYWNIDNDYKKYYMKSILAKDKGYLAWLRCQMRPLKQWSRQRTTIEQVTAISNEMIP